MHRLFAVGVACLLVFVALMPYLPNASATSYTITGPYYDDGSVPTLYQNVTCYYTDGEVTVYTLIGSGGVPQTLSLNASLTPEYISWSSTGLANFTRLYYFAGASAANINIYLPTPTATALIYQFAIADFYGMSNPYIASVTMLNGVQQIIERKPLTVATVSLVLEQWRSYQITIQCDQGSYSQTFSAESTTFSNLEVLPGAFPVANMTGRIASGYRVNGTTIYGSYSDASNATSWVNFVISHTSLSTTVTDYSYNASGSSYSFYWGSADSTVSYTLSMYAYYNGSSHLFVYPCGAPATSTNPFSGLNGLFGSLPLAWNAGFIESVDVDVSQGIAIFLIIAALAVGSYWSMTLGCGLSYIVGLLLLYLGWWQGAVGPLILAGIVNFFVIWVEAKKREREF
jgi:hypothetical protein